MKNRKMEIIEQSMISIQDIQYAPSLEEISRLINTPLFDEFCEEMEREYKAICKIEFSKCSWEYGWNVKFKKAGKALCTVYPREDYFTVLVVVGNKEKETVEAMLSEMTPEIKAVYYSTQEGNGQRWLMFDLEDHDERYRDVLNLIRIRRNSR